MFNINSNTKFIGLQGTGLTQARISACVNDKTKHSNVRYDYFGRRVRRGTMTLNTKNGNFVIAFKEKNGWAVDVEILEKL